MPAIAENIDIVLKKRATVKDTVKHLARIVNDYSWQVKDLAEQLRGKNDYETGLNIWTWVKENIKYKKDAEKIEQLRRPARIIADGHGDCDCMTILVCSLLKENDIEPFAKVVAYPERDEETGEYKKNIFGKYVSAGYSHIYSFFYYEGRPVYIDTVPEIKEYDFEYQPIVNYKIINIMELHELAGLAEVAEMDIDELSNLDTDNVETDPEIIQEEVLLGKVVIVSGSQVDGNELARRVNISALMKFKEALQNDKEAPEDLRFYENHDQEIAIIEAIIDTLQTADDETAIDILEKAAEKSNYDDFYNEIIEELKENDSEFYGVEVIENDLGRRKARKKRRKPPRKQRGGKLKKYGLAPMRLAFLQLVALNALKMGEKLALGYATTENATAYGLTPAEHQKFVAAKNKFVSWWKRAGGSEAKLKQAIYKSRKVKQAHLNGELGVAVEALMSSASAIVVAFAKIFKGLKLPKKGSKGGHATDKGKEHAKDKNQNANQNGKTNPNATAPATDVTTSQPDKAAPANFKERINKSVNEFMKPSTPQAKKKRNYVIIAFVVVIFGVTLYFVIRSNKRKNLRGTPKKRSYKRKTTTRKTTPKRKTTSKKRKPAKRKPTYKVYKKVSAAKRKTASKKRKPAKRKTTTKRRKTAKRK